MSDQAPTQTPPEQVQPNQTSNTGAPAAPADPTPLDTPPAARPVVDATPAEEVEKRKLEAAQNADAVRQPMPAKFGHLPEGMDSNQEWVYDGNIQGAPEWVDRAWASFTNGQPSLAVPVVGHRDAPYTTQTAYKGDTIKLVMGEGSTPPRFVVVPKTEDEEVS